MVSGAFSDFRSFFQAKLEIFFVVPADTFDNVKGKNEHDQLIQQFEQRQIDVLVGTQMVVKGLDFENVHLAAVINGTNYIV